ncbi:uncharacterized protein LOC110893391 [Helianthus annuus]|uniref:uncharacterized protein LOC110893391 n=1 Tax=Helianthus annuus TaxID=4232 RepID=UPI000B8EF432|nr:uncharacterized protein LOC110893391 [Helianthus annuus]
MVLDDSENTPGTAPIRGIGLRVTNIEGNPLMPRRGIYATNNPSIIDGLAAISKPVNLGKKPENRANSSGDQETMGINDVDWLFEGMENNNMPKGNFQAQGSYASKLKSGSSSSKQKVNFRFLEPKETVEDADVAIPIESVKKVQERFTNVLFGYFLGKRLAFPVVEYFVTKRWEKYGLQKCMMNGKGFFFFKFNSKEGMEQVMQDGPWLIRNIPIFLKYWSTNTELKKEELQKIPVWIKLYDVPLAAYTEDGLSLIASKVGVPKLLDNETARMCSDSWGRSSFARAIVEVDAVKDLKESVSVAIPNMEDGGFLKSSINIEYEWTPPRCSDCHIFGHTLETCPKVVKPIEKQVPNVKTQEDDQGYQVVGKKKTGKPVVKGKQSNVLEKDDIDQDEVREPETETTMFMENSMKDDGLLTGASTPAVEVNDVCRRISKGWEWISNGSLCNKGTRIVIGWNPKDVNVMLLSATMQVMHIQVIFKGENKAMYCSMVYANNDFKERRDLWESLKVHKLFVNNNPWVIMGDFNSALNLGDSYMGASGMSVSMMDFQDCVANIEVFDVNCSGMQFTWNQKPKQGMGIMKKIDRIMINSHFTDAFPNSFAVFQPHRISDHSPCVLKLPGVMRSKPKPFKFPNFLTLKPEFIDVVKDGWDLSIEGVPMFRVVKKLRALKHLLRNLLRKQGNIHVRVTQTRKDLDEIQSRVDKDPANVSLKNLAADCLKKFNEASLDEESFLKQKAKQKWLQLGDANTKFFLITFMQLKLYIPGFSQFVLTPLFINSLSNCNRVTTLLKITELACIGGFTFVTVLSHQQC